MTLKLAQVAKQVQAMGQEATRQLQAGQTLLSRARTLLKTHGDALDELEARVHRAEQVSEGVRFSWLGAAPAGERLDVWHPPPPPLTQATVIASDGSQIYPDRHGIALYYLVNVGVIVFRHGSGERPETYSEPHLYYHPNDLLTEQGLLVPTGVVNVQRDMAEVDMLRRFSLAYRQPGIPLAALIDGQLSLRLIDLPAAQQETYLRQYLDALDDLRRQGALLAAYIDRPRASYVLSLLNLAEHSPERITEDVLRRNPFAGLTDAALFRELPPGHRTALFKWRAKGNIAYAEAGHSVHFFYLNTGSADRPNVVRVEIPRWVAEDATRLDALHAILQMQITIAGGYPYVLARAHELAIISPAEREALETMLAIEMRRHGMAAEVSLKQAHKNALTGR